MNKTTNYNYAFLLYDIKENRVQKVFKICKKYFNHHQKSVFRGDITPSNLIKLKKELLKVIDQHEDFVTIIKFLNRSSFSEETLGINIKQSNSMFI
ncbi:MAG: CRISPR-associated protein Cas2 [Clostridiales bacterium]|jgi:CRISPR-associated protein Cas2|nr:CRISPR-associated protein Cas2 [Clostridiales bacterium]